MTKEVISVTEEALVTHVAQLMTKNKIHGIPVLNENGVVGIITETDFFTKGEVNVYLPSYIELIRAGVGAKESDQNKRKIDTLLKATAKDIMTTPCLTISEDADVHEFMGLVKGRGLASVPVVNKENELVGIITLSDVINFLRL